MGAITATNKILVWDDETLNWLIKIVAHMKERLPKYGYKFNYIDCSQDIYDYVTVKEQDNNIYLNHKKLTSYEKTKDNMLIFDIYHTVNVETANFAEYALFLTDIRLVETYGDARSANIPNKEQYGAAVLAKKAIQNNVPVIAVTQNMGTFKDYDVINKAKGDFVLVVPKSEIEMRGNESLWVSVVAQMIHSTLVREWYLQEYNKQKVQIQVLQEENRQLAQELKYNPIVGESEHVKSLLTIIKKVAPKLSTVLITGESGTGKELVAKTIHGNSDRCGNPFQAVNCAAIPPSLLESTLFGYDKGAFTGADKNHVGHIEAADGGTLFLDEIGEMDLLLQAKLLRFLQERTYSRVGSVIEKKADVRIIAATNLDLNEAIREGVFREDLYYRLNVISLHCKPLRERKDDILLLANVFLKSEGDKVNNSGYYLTEETKRALVSCDWPGNIRELKNCIERMVILSETDAITPDLMEIGGNSSTKAWRYDNLVPLDQEIVRVVIDQISLVLADPTKRYKVADIFPRIYNSKLKSLQAHGYGAVEYEDRYRAIFALCYYALEQRCSDKTSFAKMLFKNLTGVASLEIPQGLLFNYILQCNKNPLKYKKEHIKQAALEFDSWCTANSIKLPEICNS